MISDDILKDINEAEDDLFPPIDRVGHQVDGINTHASPNAGRRHRRVRSSGARLNSPMKPLEDNNHDDEKSACSYEIPHLSLQSKSYDHSTHFSSFARSQADKLLFASSPTVPKRNVTRTFSMRLEKGLQSPSTSPYKMKQSKTLLANFTYRDESQNGGFDDDEDSVVSMGSSISSSNLSSCKMSSWENIELTIDKKTGRIEIANKIKKDENHRDVNEVHEDKKVHTTEKQHSKNLSTRLGKWLRRGGSSSSTHNKKGQDKGKDEIMKRRKLISKLRNDRQRYLEGCSSNDTVPLVVSSTEDDSTQSSKSDVYSSKSMNRNCLTSMMSPKPHLNTTPSSCLTGMTGRRPNNDEESTECFTTMIRPKSMESDTSLDLSTSTRGPKLTDNGRPSNCIKSAIGSKTSYDEDVSNMLKVRTTTTRTPKEKIRIKVQLPSEKELPTVKTPKKKVYSPEVKKRSNLKGPRLQVSVASKNSSKKKPNRNPITISSKPYDPLNVNSLDDSDEETSSMSNNSLFSFTPQCPSTPSSRSLASCRSVTSTSSRRSLASCRSTSSRSIASTSKYNVVQIEETPEKLFSADLDNSGYADDTGSICSAVSSSSSIYTDSSSIRDPCAKQSRTVQRSKKLRELASDGDVWIEKLYVSRRTGKKRIYFVSVNTGERRRDEPPSGAAVVLYSSDLFSRRKDIDHTGPETIYVCTSAKEKPSLSAC